MNAKAIGKKIVFLVYLSGIVIGTLLSFQWISTYFEHGQLPEYKDLSEEIKLKSEPKDVLYATDQKTRDGRDIVLYAYMADEVPVVEGEDVLRRTENSQTEVLEVRMGEGGEKIEKLKTTFYAAPQFYEDEGEWRQVEYATTTPEVFSMSGAIPYVKRRELVERLIPGESVFALTGTYYPNPNTESTSVDGSATYSEYTNWATAVGAAAGSAADDSATTISVAAGQFDYYGINYFIIRAFLLFDTSAMPDSASISAATLDVYVTSKSNDDNDGTDTVNLVTSTPASNTAIVTGDYDQVGSVLQASALDITSVTTSADNTFTLNSTGRGNISLTGVTKFAIREGHDLGSSETAYNTDNSIVFSSAEETGTTNDPTLTITYTTSTFSFGNWFPF